MAFLAWSKQYEVGLPEVDSEHQLLFHLVNEIHENQERSGQAQDNPALFGELMTHTVRHFEHEEALMERMRYPLLNEHRKQHADLVASLENVSAWIATEPRSVNTAVLRFLKKWLVEHIVSHDMDIGRHARNERSTHAARAA